MRHTDPHRLTWTHRIALFAAALILALMVWAFLATDVANAGGAPCEPVLVIDRPAGSLKVYPGGGGEQETLTLFLCPDGSVRGKLQRFRNQKQEIKP